jgi:molybdopterin molybdotransferase
VKALGEAQREVLAAMRPLPAKPVALADALGLVLAEPVIASHAVPGFANSAVDGFAVRSVDTAVLPATLRIVDDLPAGATPTVSVSEATTVRIMTGAPIPDGADAVVMVEDTETAGDRVVVTASAAAGDHVRPAGGDIEAGSVVFEAGERLTPVHLGVLASIGVSEPLVRRRPRVALVSTGDELVPAGEVDVRPGLVRDSNGPMLAGLLRELGADLLELGIVPDDESRLRSAFGAAAGAGDAVVTTGGVSMGEHDLVKSVLGHLGGVEFWQVAMQPAKPFAFGLIDRTPVFGLPGNPVSAFVAFEQFVRPALLARMGASRLFRPRTRATLAEPVATNPEKAVFLRVTVTEGLDGATAHPAPRQASNVLSAVAGSDAFGVVPAGVGSLDAGDEIVVEWFGSRETRSAEEALG